MLRTGKVLRNIVLQMQKCKMQQDWEINKPEKEISKIMPAQQKPYTCIA